MSVCVRMCGGRCDVVHTCVGWGVWEACCEVAESVTLARLRARMFMLIGCWGHLPVLHGQCKGEAFAPKSVLRPFPDVILASSL